MKISIDPSKSIYENASVHFEASKKSKRKAIDTDAAIKESEKELLNFEKDMQKLAERKEKEAETNMKKEWYHQFHWFHTSEGFLAIGGKDAKQNELLVKKHFGDKDLFFHADIHGASAVILRDGRKAVEKSLQEAAQFAGCYSTAWKARLGGVDVYTVGKDQVKTSAPSGEYLAKGSFLITGKKQYFKGVEMRMYLGKKTGGEGNICVVPSLMGNEMFSHCYELIPGRKEKEEVAKELSKELGIKADEIAVLLPGGSEIKRIK